MRIEIDVPDETIALLAKRYTNQHAADADDPAEEAEHRYNCVEEGANEALEQIGHLALDALEANGAFSDKDRSSE